MLSGFVTSADGMDHVLGDGGFANVDAQLQKLAMDRGAPQPGLVKLIFV